MDTAFISFTGLYYLYYVCWFIVNAFAAIWIYSDAKNLPVLFIGSKPIWWSFAALVLGGVWVLLVYWAIHHSTISNRINSET